MLYALDLFSGIGGNSIGLKDYVRTVAYCEADRHAQAVLLSRMSDGSLPVAPICTDVTGLDGYAFRGKVDCIIAGFPCQDISVAGKGAGLEGERSGLFFEIVRLAKEVQPTFLFLENVPTIRTRGLDRVVEELTEAGYDCRWTMLSAADVGAPHKRERWFCLARRRLPNSNQQYDQSHPSSLGSPSRARQQQVGRHGLDGVGSEMANTDNPELEGWNCRSLQEHSNQQFTGARDSSKSGHYTRTWWESESNVGRVANGVPQRVDRIKRLGNAVVPAQAKEAFEVLMGIEKLQE